MAKKPIIKADANGLTNEQKAEQVARFFSQKRESYFQLILGNLLHGALPGVDKKRMIDECLEAADYAIERLYPLPIEKKEGE